MSKYNWKNTNCMLINNEIKWVSGFKTDIVAIFFTDLIFFFIHEVNPVEVKSFAINIFLWVLTWYFTFWYFILMSLILLWFFKVVILMSILVIVLPVLTNSWRILWKIPLHKLWLWFIVNLSGLRSFQLTVLYWGWLIPSRRNFFLIFISNLV